jgi:hypothetical protein
MFASESYPTFPIKIIYFSEIVTGDNLDLKSQREILFLGCGHCLHRNCIDLNSNEFACPSCFLTCKIEDEASSSRQSPQKFSVYQNSPFEDSDGENPSDSIF